MIFSTPTTPTRERLTRVAGASAWASRLGEVTVSVESAIGSSMPEPVSRRPEIAQNLVELPGPTRPYTHRRFGLGLL